jgi:AraC-like DNA-binding protein
VKDARRGSAEFAGRRRTRFLPDGSYHFVDPLRIRGVVRFPLITCTGWLIEVYDLRSGELLFARGTEWVRPRRRRFAVVYPPFSISEIHLKNTAGRVAGLAATESLPESIPAVPTLFDTDLTVTDVGKAGAAELLRSFRNPEMVEFNPQASALSRRAKRLIDQSCREARPLSQVAAQLKVTPEHLSRQFKRDFRMSPREYLHHLRVADAPLLLVRQEEIATVAHELGYRDLSRFYRQFRKQTKTSPAFCRRMIAPAAARKDQKAPRRRRPPR